MTILSIYRNIFDEMAAASERYVIRFTGNKTVNVQEIPDVTDVIIEEGFETIGREAFALNTKIVNVTLPTSMKSIGVKAFLLCRSLRRINLDTVTLKNKRL